MTHTRLLTFFQGEQSGEYLTVSAYLLKAENPVGTPEKCLVWLHGCGETASGLLSFISPDAP